MFTAAWGLFVVAIFRCKILISRICSFTILLSVLCIKQQFQTHSKLLHQWVSHLVLSRGLWTTSIDYSSRYISWRLQLFNQDIRYFKLRICAISRETSTALKLRTMSFFLFLFTNSQLVFIKADFSPLRWYLFLSYLKIKVSFELETDSSTTVLVFRFVINRFILIL